MFKKIIITSLVLLFAACSTPTPKSEPVLVEPEPEPIEVFNRNVFDGSRKDDTEYKAIAIMISNIDEARPQSGLSMADIVYEISVESMIVTRYMAIFEGQFPTKVGPIRSVRLPFVNKLDEWDIAFAHYGGAGVGKGDALTPLNKMFIPIRFDGVAGINSQFFSRDRARVAPHNAYMNVQKASEKFPEMWPRETFTFVDEKEYEGDPATEISIDYTSRIRNGYTYDEGLNKYRKSMNDKPQMDVYNDEQITVSNIIVQHADHSMVEKVQYVLVNFYYAGDAEYFIGGKHIKGRWVKDFKDDITHFYDMDDKPIEMLAGNTWIHIVHPKVKISYE